MSVTTIHLQPEIEQSLQAMTVSLKKSKDWLINQALQDYIDRQHVEQERWQQTLHAMDSVAQGNVVSGDAVHAWLRSWGDENELPPPIKDKK